MQAPETRRAPSGSSISRLVRFRPFLGRRDGFHQRWSPDGRYPPALSSDLTRLFPFDFQTQKWTEVAKGSLGWPWFSKDGQYLYFQDSSGTGPNGLRFWAFSIFSSQQLPTAPRAGRTGPTGGLLLDFNLFALPPPYSIGGGSPGEVLAIFPCRVCSFTSRLLRGWTRPYLPLPGALGVIQALANPATISQPS